MRELQAELQQIAEKARRRKMEALSRKTRFHRELYERYIAVERPWLSQRAESDTSAENKPYETRLAKALGPLMGLREEPSSDGKGTGVQGPSFLSGHIDRSGLMTTIYSAGFRRPVEQIPAIIRWLRSHGCTGLRYQWAFYPVRLLESETFAP